MKKQVKFLSAVMALALVSGVATVNKTANADETIAPTNVFTMSKGASVRIPDVTNTDVTTNDNGIRFTAYMSTDKYSETSEYGTFIMPLDYYTANPVSAETIVNNYYWKTGEDAEGNAVYNTTETDGKKQIINVEAIAYLDEVDYNEDKVTEEMYVINGSVRHIKADNLNYDYIGVSYIKNGDEYTFATQTTDNARTVVEVAQKALLNADTDDAFVENELGTKAEKITAVDNAYTARYISVYQENNEGDYPTVEMNVRVHKDVSSTSGYVAEDTVAKVEVPFTAWNATTTGEAQEREGYTYVSLKTEAVNVMLDGSTQEIVQYFDYTANDIVLWDGDDKLADTTFGITDNWSMTDRTSGAHESAVVSDALVYTGNSMKIKPDTDGWDGPLWKQAITGIRYLSLYVDAPKEGTVRYETFALTTSGSKGWIVGSLALNAGLQKVTIDLGEEMVGFYGLNFKTRFNGEYLAYAIDNICVEKEAYTEQSVKLPDVFESDFTVTVPEVKSTVYFGTDVIPAATVEYKETTAEAWTAAQDNTVTPATGVNTYNVRVSVGEEVIAEKTIRRGLMVATFDEAPGDEITVGTTTFVNYAANRNYIVASTYSQYWKYDNQSGDTAFAAVGSIANVDGYSGQFWRGNVNIWPANLLKKGGAQFNTDTTKQFTKVGMWIYTASDWTTTKGYILWLGNMTGVDASGAAIASAYAQLDGARVNTIKAGYNYYEFTLENVASFSDAKRIELNFHSNIYVDQIAFIY